MHTNHRRKKRNRYKYERGVISKGWRRDFGRFKHNYERQEVRRRIHHEEWDDIPDKYYKDLVWDYF